MAQIAIARISGVNFKIGGKLYSIDQLVGKTFYATRNVTYTKPSRYDSNIPETVTARAGDPLGVFYSYSSKNGKQYLMFDYTTFDKYAGKDIGWAYLVEYSPGLIELDSLAAQGTKDVITEEKEKKEKEEGKSEGFLDQFTKPLTIGILVVASALAVSMLRK